MGYFCSVLPQKITFIPPGIKKKCYAKMFPLLSSSSSSLWFYSSKHKGVALKTFYPRLLPPHTFLSTLLPPQENPNKKKSMLKQHVCVGYHSKQPTAQWEESSKLPSGWSLGSSFHAQNWSPKHRNQHLYTGSRLHSCNDFGFFFFLAKLGLTHRSHSFVFGLCVRYFLSILQPRELWALTSKL